MSSGQKSQFQEKKEAALNCIVYIHLEKIMYSQPPEDPW